MKQFTDLVLLLMFASLVYMPLVLPLMLPGVSVNSMGIAQSLLVTMILPLSIGLCIKARRESLAVRLRPIFSQPRSEARRVMGFGAAARNIPAALLVARENFVDPKVMIMVIVVALLSLIVPAPLTIVFAQGNRA